jgi:DNA-binding GntR family transcriptional regulator
VFEFIDVRGKTMINGENIAIDEAGRMRPLAAINLRNHIEEEIRRAILRGRFKPGERLVESTIASEIGVSRAPVREVLSALERVGLVMNIPRRGSFVIDFTPKDIEEIYTLRLLLEVEAVHLAAEHLREVDLQDMQAIIDQLGEAMVRQDDPEAIIRLDLSFHERICLKADHSRLYNAWNSMRMQTMLLISMTSRTHYGLPNQTVKWHQDILDAIRDGKIHLAENIVSNHLMDAMQRAAISFTEVHLLNQTNIVE